MGNSVVSGFEELQYGLQGQYNNLGLELSNNNNNNNNNNHKLNRETRSVTGT
eukprot:Pgem_evm1s17862